MIVFLAGIHGVGKTYLGAPTAQRLGIRYATASQLIREERGLQTWGADKRVTGIDANQAALVTATARLRADGQKLLLDGHFVLREANGSFTEIDAQVFRSLEINAVVLLVADVRIVVNRLRERGDNSWAEEDLLSLANREEAHAHRVAAALCIPVIPLVNPTGEEFEKTLNDLINA